MLALHVHAPVFHVTGMNESCRSFEGVLSGRALLAYCRALLTHCKALLADDTALLADDRVLLYEPVLSQV